MPTPSGSFTRDASGRLTFEMFDVDSSDYPKYATRVVDVFDLSPTSELVIGLDQMFRDYTDGKTTVGLDWDIWSGFMIVAKSPSAEPLVRKLGAYLIGD